MIATYLPLAGNALLFSSAVYWLLRRFIHAPLYRISIAIGSFVIALLPIADLSLAAYMAGIFANLSITTLLLLAISLSNRKPFETPLKVDYAILIITICTLALLLYPSALGYLQIDLYADGYYPVVLAPLLLSLAIIGLFNRWYLLCAVLALVYLGYIFQLFESNNLWDYLMDPLLAVFCLSRLPKAIKAIRPIFNRHTIEQMLLTLAAIFLLFAVFLSHYNEDAFRYRLVMEDGFIESVTALALFAAMWVSVSRMLKLRKVRSGVFIAMTGFVAFVGLFGAGEEISWGQRIFGWETPAYFMENNKQEETGLHNLVVNVEGERVNLNKVIFGRGLALAMLIYLFVMTPLYRKQSPRKQSPRKQSPRKQGHHKQQAPKLPEPDITTGTGFANFIDQLAIPMPRNYQIIGYLVVIACVELLIDSSKRGEMTEFAGSIVFLLNVAFPYNHQIFNPQSFNPGQQPPPTQANTSN